MMARSAVRAAVAAFAFLIWVGIGAAQDTAPDYAAWQTVAERAEEAVENAEASNQVLEDLRAEIVDWRQEFQGQLNSNDNRIATLQEQVEALGPSPEEGETEAEEIANRRAELNAQIERLTTPRRIAEEAFSRTNGIISEIDQIIRDRQANALLDAGPWPINPAHWADAIRQLRHSALAAVAGAQQSWGTPSRREQARDNLPLVLFLITLGAILLARARRWSEWLAQRLLRDDNRATAQIADFVVSLGQIILPMLGLWAIVRGAGATGLFAARGQSLLDTLEAVGFVLFFTLWLVGRVFPRDDFHRSGPGGLTPRRRAEARLYVLAMGGMLALYVLLLELSQFDRYSRATDAVLHYPLTLVASLLLMRMGWIMRQARRNIGEEDIAADRDLYLRFVVWLGQVLIVVGVVAPALATFGYGNAAEYLIYPTIVTLYLFGTVRLLQVLVYDIFRAVSGKDSIDDSLIPTLSSFVLVLAALLVLPLIWGARVTDMSEMWTRVRGGLTVGGITISPASFFTLIIVFGLGYAITRATQNALKVAVLPKTRIDPGGQVAIVSGLGYVGIFLAGLVAITSAGMDLSNLAIVAGALSVGIGFGLQTIVSNFVSGIILLIERPISEGDWIEVGGQMGYVRSISVRSTRIETFDRTDVIVPNADLISGTVTNFTRGNTVGRVIIPVGVAYGTDTRRVEAILREIAEAHPMALMNPPPAIVFAGFGADSLDFEIRMILRDVNWMLVVKSEVNHQIAARFTEEEIEIPFAQRDVWLRNPEALKTDTKSTPSAPAAQEPPAATPVPEFDPDVDGDGDGDGEGR